MKNIRAHNSYQDQHSTWSERNPSLEFPRLEESLETDVAIIGGGITGLLCAYLIQKTGKRVVVLEARAIGSGASRLTTAFLTASIDTDFSDLIKTFGPRHAKEIVASHAEAIDLIELIVKDENIECEFARCSDFIFASKEKHASDLSEEFDAAAELGLAVDYEKDGSKLCFKNYGYIEIKGQAKFNPMKFISGLSKRLSESGVRIFEGTAAEEILDRDFGYSVRARDHSVQAKWVVSSTYEPFNEPLRLFFKKGMYKTYVLEAHTEWKIPDGTYEDTENPYHYFRVDSNKTEYRIILGGEDHRQDLHVDEARNFNALKDYLDTLIPKESYLVRKMWSGPILEPVDGLGFIGNMRMKKNVLYAFGFSGNGMTYAGIAAMILRDRIEGKKNKWAHLYEAKRVPSLKSLLTKGKDYTGELFKGAFKNVTTSSKKLSDRLPKRKKDQS